MSNDKITPINRFRKNEKTDVELCLEAVQSMETGPRIGMTAILNEPTEELGGVLRHAIETSRHFGVDLKDTLFPGVIGYYKGLVSGKDKTINGIKESHGRQLEWIQLSLRNRFGLTNDDELMADIDKLKISNIEANQNDDH